MPDLPLIEAAKLWARVSARTGAAYLTGRWGGCRVLVFENLERASEAEPSHFLFLGEAGEWPHPEQATTPVGGRGVDTGSPRATGRSCRCDRGRGGEKPVQRRRKVHGDTASKLPRKARKRCEGWSGSVYRRPRDGAAAPVEAKDGPFIEDLLDDLGRG